MPMEFKQKTIGDIIESEHLMLSTAPQRYGAYYTIAIDLSEFLSSAVKSIDRDHRRSMARSGSPSITKGPVRWPLSGRQAAVHDNFGC